MSRRSSPTKKGTQSEAGCSSLPPEVTAVSERIGLETGDGLKTMYEKVGSDEFNAIKYHPCVVKNVEKQIARYSEAKKSKSCKKEKKKKRKDRLTSKERRELFDVTKSKDLRYSVLIGLNDLWRGYMISLLSSIKSPADQLRLIRADFHGAMLVVSASKNPALVGIKGIVIQETKNTFRLITKEDRVVTVSKVGTVFAFESQGNLYKLNGSQLAMSPHQRARTKPKIRAKLDIKQEI